MKKYTIYFKEDGIEFTGTVFANSDERVEQYIKEHGYEDIVIGFICE